MTALLMDTTQNLTTRLGEELGRQDAGRLRRKVLRRLIWDTEALAGITLSAWKWVRESLEAEGFEGRELIRHCQIILEGINRGLVGYEHLRKLAEESGLTSGVAGLKELEAKLPALQEARAAVGQALSLADRPPRPVDGKVLAESEAALERGEFVTLDDQYLDRLRAGEDF
jgi:hypothetical protein